MILILNLNSPLPTTRPSTRIPCSPELLDKALPEIRLSYFKQNCTSRTPICRHLRSWSPPPVATYHLPLHAGHDSLLLDFQGSGPARCIM